MLPTVLARNVGQDWHKAGTFRHHLVGVTRSLTECGSNRAMCACWACCTSVYGNATVDLVKFDPPNGRQAACVNWWASAEHLVYLFWRRSHPVGAEGAGQGMEEDGSLLLDKDGRAAPGSRPTRWPPSPS